MNFDERAVRRDPKGQFAPKPARGGAAGDFDGMGEPDGYWGSLEQKADAARERAIEAANEAARAQRIAIGLQAAATLEKLARDGVEDVVVDGDPYKDESARLLSFSTPSGELALREDPGFASGSQLFGSSSAPTALWKAMQTFRPNSTAVRFKLVGSSLAISDEDGSNSESFGLSITPP